MYIDIKIPVMNDRYVQLSHIAEFYGISMAEAAYHCINVCINTELLREVNEYV